MEKDSYVDRMVPVNEAVKLLGISQSTLYRYEDQGLIVSLRTPGGHRRYSIMEIEEFKFKMKSGIFIPKRGRPSKSEEQISFNFKV